MTLYVEFPNSGVNSFTPVTWTLTATPKESWGTPPSATVTTNMYDLTASWSSDVKVVTSPLLLTWNTVVLPVGGRIWYKFISWWVGGWLVGCGGGRGGDICAHCLSGLLLEWFTVYSTDDLVLWDCPTAILLLYSPYMFFSSEENSLCRDHSCFRVTGRCILHVRDLFTSSNPRWIFP